MAIFIHESISEKDIERLAKKAKLRVVKNEYGDVVLCTREAFDDLKAKINAHCFGDDLYCFQPEDPETLTVKTRREKH